MSSIIKGFIFSINHNPLNLLGSMYLSYTYTFHGYYSAPHSELRQLIVLWSNTKQLIRVFKCLDSAKLNNLQKDAKINGSHVLSRAASFRT